MVKHFSCIFSIISSRWSQTLFTQNQQENEESKDNFTPTDGTGKLLVEGTRKTEWQNPE